MTALSQWTYSPPARQYVSTAGTRWWSRPASKPCRPRAAAPCTARPSRLRSSTRSSISAALFRSAAPGALPPGPLRARPAVAAGRPLHAAACSLPSASRARAARRAPSRARIGRATARSRSGPTAEPTATDQLALLLLSRAGHSVALAARKRRLRLAALMADPAIISRAVISRAIIGRATISRAIVNRAIISRAIIGRAIISRAIVNRAIISRAIIGRAIIGRAIIGRSATTGRPMTPVAAAVPHVPRRARRPAAHGRGLPAPTSSAWV
jgi:hypothetical protein